MINYKHLRYFLQVSEAGGVARAAAQLHVTPQTISGQIQLLEDRLGTALFAKSGRRLVLTDAGGVLVEYARDIFALGAEMEAAVRQPAARHRVPEFRVGVADAVPKLVAYHLIEPGLAAQPGTRLVCREWKLDSLLAELALHRLDLVISDAPIPPAVSVRAFSHRLGSARIGFFAASVLRRRHRGPFPGCLDGAPVIMPASESSLGQRLRAWFQVHGLRPNIVGEFDDAALAHEFGRRGAGFFAAPRLLALELESHLRVEPVGIAAGVDEEFFAISVERRITHPCVVAVTRVARGALTQRSSGGKKRRVAGSSSSRLKPRFPGRGRAVK